MKEEVKAIPRSALSLTTLRAITAFLDSSKELIFFHESTFSTKNEVSDFMTSKKKGEADPIKQSSVLFVRSSVPVYLNDLPSLIRDTCSNCSCNRSAIRRFVSTDTKSEKRPSGASSCPKSVSYTHLTLPTSDLV